MTTDLLLAIAHHLLVFALVAVLAAETVLVRPGLKGRALARLGGLDRFYGMAAGLIIIVGFSRVFFGLKGLGILHLQLGVLGKDRSLRRRRAADHPADHPHSGLEPQGERQPWPYCPRQRNRFGSELPAGARGRLRTHTDLRRRHGARPRLLECVAYNRPHPAVCRHVALRHPLCPAGQRGCSPASIPESH